MFNLKSLCLAATLAAGVATAAVLPTVFSQEELPKPTKVHEALLSSVGDWEGTLTMMMPGMEPMASPCSETVKAFGPYHTVMDFKCSFMGMEFMGHGISGYDPKTEKLHGTWTDTMSMHTSVMSGTTDLESGRTEMHWKAYVMGSDDLVPHRYVMDRKDDSYKMTFYQGEGDAEFTSMTIEMSRKK